MHPRLKKFKTIDFSEFSVRVLQINAKLNWNPLYKLWKVDFTK